MLKLTSKEKIILETMLDAAINIVVHYGPELDDPTMLEEAEATGRTIRRMLDHPEEFNKDTVIPYRKDFLIWYQNTEFALYPIQQCQSLNWCNNRR